MISWDVHGSEDPIEKRVTLDPIATLMAGAVEFDAEGRRKVTGTQCRKSK